MMITTKDYKYKIMHDKKHNQIIISLPQTTSTATSTAGQFSNRKEELTEGELTSLLYLTQKMFEGDSK